MGDQPRPLNLPLSGEMVGRPNEWRMVGSRGEGERKRGISFMGDEPLVVEPAVADFPMMPLPLPLPAPWPWPLTFGDLDGRESAPKNREGSFSLVGEGKGGGPMSEVDRWRFGSLTKVGERG